MRIARLFLSLPLLATALVSIIQGSRHFAWDWPVHAHHHLLANISNAVGLAIVSLLIVYGPLRRGEPWSWWALFAAGTAIYGGYWMGNVTVGLGEPGTIPNTSQAVQTLFFAVGLILAWRAIHRKSDLQQNAQFRL